VNNGFPTWSPEGARIAFKRGKQLVVAKVLFSRAIAKSGEDTLGAIRCPGETAWDSGVSG